MIKVVLESTLRLERLFVSEENAPPVDHLVQDYGKTVHVSFLGACMMLIRIP